jgi:CheY-like chemotaxis protein
MMNDIESVVVPRAARKQLELKKILDPDSEEPVIEGDKDKIRQVLMALINNSIKFTSTGQIDFGYHLNDNSALFFVKDTGIGIPPALHHKIFDRFYQVEQDHRKKYGGTGLGLSIAKEIVTMMGGSIWVDSEPEHGSTFYFTFPLPAPPVTDITEGNSIDWSVIKDLTILVAEDEPFNFEYLHKLLLNRVKKIIWAQNGAEVIPLARIHEPNLYLMDIKMPVMDGLEATRQIRSENSQVPVIALTAYSRPEDQAAALASGCNAFISKPFRRNELFETMLREIRMFRTGL